MGSPKTAKRRRQRQMARAARQSAARPAARARSVSDQCRDEQLARDAEDAARWRADRPRVEAQTYARFDLDDRRHRPRSSEPLMTGQARVTGATAKAIRRSKALTKFEWDQMQQDGER